jgi:hypothetical protein
MVFARLLVKYPRVGLTAVIIGGTSWSGLGFYRGTQHYKYRTEYYKRNYFYSDAFIMGLFGTTLYSAPPFCFFMIYKELQRLETNIRHLEIKDVVDYNSLL